MGSVILGDWTHRRGDAGGARAVPAEFDRPRPSVAWSWQPDHGGRVDQVRVGGSTVIVATMMPRDPSAPRWEHAVVYVLDARTGVELARRVLPDPVPVAAMVLEDGVVHVISTRKGEPIFWYALTGNDLVPLHRRIVSMADSWRHDDVLDAWGTPDGGLWIEFETSADDARPRVRAFAFADPSGSPATPHALGLRDAAEGPASSGPSSSSRLSWPPPSSLPPGPPIANDACAGGHQLFVPSAGRWGAESDPAPPLLSRLDRGAHRNACEASWASATVVGPRSRIHALGADGVVCAVAVADDPGKGEQARIEAFAVDRSSGVVRWRAQDDRLAIRPSPGDGARMARRPNGEILFQSLGLDGVPTTPLICARPDGRLDAIVLGGKGRYVLDASLGDLVLAHRENKEGRVEVGGFSIDQEGRLLGRRAIPRWTIDLGDLGGAATVYAGAGAVVVRGLRSVSAIRM